MKGAKGRTNMPDYLKIAEKHGLTRLNEFGADLIHADILNDKLYFPPH